MPSPTPAQLAADDPAGTALLLSLDLTAIVASVALLALLVVVPAIIAMRDVRGGRPDPAFDPRLDERRPPRGGGGEPGAHG
jgi:hypothetical protein